MQRPKKTSDKKVAIGCLSIFLLFSGIAVIRHLASTSNEIPLKYRHCFQGGNDLNKEINLFMHSRYDNLKITLKDTTYNEGADYLFVTNLYKDDGWIWREKIKKQEFTVDDACRLRTTTGWYVKDYRFEGDYIGSNSEWNKLKTNKDKDDYLSWNTRFSPPAEDLDYQKYKLEKLARENGSTDIETILSDGSKYSGELIDGIPNGQGISTSPNGDVYRGGFKDGAKDGYGIYSPADGSEYQGYFKSGKPQGQGYLIKSDGTRYTVIWSGDKYEIQK